MARWDGRGYIELPDEHLRSVNFSPVGDEGDTGGVISRGRQVLLPGQIMYRDVEVNLTTDIAAFQVERYTVLAQFLRGGRGHLVVVPPLPGGAPGMAFYPTSLGRGPGLLADQSETVLDKSGGIVAPYYAPGQWIRGPIGTPAFKALVADIAAYEPAAPSLEHFHCGGNVMRSEVPGADWQEIAFRIVWGPDNPIDLRSFAHYMAVIGLNSAGEAKPNMARYVTMEFTSYPFRTDRPDDHVDVAGKGGVADAAWSWAAALTLPSPWVMVPGWPGPRGEDELPHNTGWWNPVDPPSQARFDVPGGSYYVFPFARAMNELISNSVYAETVSPLTIDRSRITAMQIRVKYPVANGGIAGTPWSWCGPFLLWNTWDGAMVDPAFGTNAFFAPLSYQYSPRIAIANVGTEADEVRFFLAPTGMP